MALITVKEDHVKFFGSNYFIDNAVTVSLGSYGKKMNPLLIGTGKLEVKDRVPVPKLEGIVRTGGPHTLDAQASSQAALERIAGASLDFIPGIGKLDGKIKANSFYSDLVNQRLKFVHLFVDEEPMKDAINKSPDVKENLRNYGTDARIAHSLLVVTEASFASSFTSGLSFEVKADALKVLTITAKDGGVVEGKDKITLAPGTSFAYLLLNPKWNKEKTNIESTKVDEWGLV